MFKKPKIDGKKVQNEVARGFFYVVFSSLATLGLLTQTDKAPTYETNPPGFEEIDNSLGEDLGEEGGKVRIVYNAWVTDTIGGNGTPEYIIGFTECRTRTVYEKHKDDIESLKKKDPDAKNIVDWIRRY